MKQHVMIALIMMAWAGTAGWAVSGETAPGTPEKAPSVIEADDTATTKSKRPDNSKVHDKEVAARLEILQFMDMLENFDLIKDLDVIEGGGKGS